MLVGIIVMLVGILNMYPPFVKALLEFGNTMRGSKSNITKETIKAYQIVGVVILITGVLLLIVNPRLG